ncbi:MAG: GPR endopeptidase [Firmicutes bacterium]|nr:GPR endopeptidase [Bacillota bacterium]
MKKNNAIRSDMAIELVGGDTKISQTLQIKKSRVEIDDNLSKKIGRPKGSYITLETSIVNSGRIDKYDSLSKEISIALKEITKSKIKCVLVVGLGNPNLTADALGKEVFSNLIITKHMDTEDRKKLGIKSAICAICPNVSGITGIESFDVIKGVVDRIKPDLVVAVDALASASVARLGAAFQLCSSGITPGSGVANHRVRLDYDSLGVAVVSLGVPLVVYASTIIFDAAGEEAIKDLPEELSGLIVTPKTIDILVQDCAKVIASGINGAF